MDAVKLQKWLKDFIAKSSQDFHFTQYFYLQGDGDGLIQSKYQEVESYKEQGLKYPKWKDIDDNKMLPAWIKFDFAKSNAVVDLEYSRKAGVLHPLLQDKLLPFDMSYVEKIINDLANKGIFVYQGWLAGFKPKSFYKQHLHTLANCYNFILHIPIVSGPEYKIIFHKNGTHEYNGFTPGDIYLLDPREWHSAEFNGNYVRWHMCFMAYDLGNNFRFGHCDQKIFQRHQRMADVWRSYFFNPEGEKLLPWDDSLN